MRQSGVQFNCYTNEKGSFNNADGNVDTVITSVPNNLYVGDDTLDVNAVKHLTRKIAEEAARRMGRKLHHAAFVFTDDPDVIRERVHRCPACVAGADRSIAHLTANPGIEVCVGTIWYVPE